MSFYLTQGAKAPAFDSGMSLSELAKKYGKVPVIANGGINNIDDANYLLNADKADVLSLGKAALANPDWPKRTKAKQQLNEFSIEIFNPIANLKTANKFLFA